MGLRYDFAGAPNAVRLARQLKCWDMYRETAKTETISFLMERMRESATTALHRAIAENDTERQTVLESALAEWDEPDFYLFVKAKIVGWEA